MIFLSVELMDFWHNILSVLVLAFFFNCGCVFIFIFLIKKSFFILFAFYFLFIFSFIFTLFYFTILYWFCHTLTWIHHGCTCVPKHEPPSHLPPHNISLGHHRAPAASMLYPALDIDWRFDPYMLVYMLQCHSPKSSHPLPLPLSPKVCYTHLCLFCCLAYRVVIAIFLNSIYRLSICFGTDKWEILFFVLVLCLIKPFCFHLVPIWMYLNYHPRKSLLRSRFFCAGGSLGFFI